MDPKLELVIMNLVVDSGSARSYAMEAIFHAKDGDFEEAEKSMAECEKELLKAHHSQTELIQQEARGEKIPLSLIMVHAQDHLMTTTVVKDLAKEIIDLHRKVGK